jgi:hypothetical protein
MHAWIMQAYPHARKHEAHKFPECLWHTHPRSNITITKSCSHAYITETARHDCWNEDHGNSRQGLRFVGVPSFQTTLNWRMPASSSCFAVKSLDLISISCTSPPCKKKHRHTDIRGEVWPGPERSFPLCHQRLIGERIWIAEIFPGKLTFAGSSSLGFFCKLSMAYGFLFGVQLDRFSLKKKQSCCARGTPRDLAYFGLWSRS